VEIIVGGGKYGVEAARYLEKRSRSYVVIDPNENCLASRELNLEAVEADRVKDGRNRRVFVRGGVEVLAKLARRLRLEYIFPTAPVHVAAEALRTEFNLRPWNEVVDCILANLPSKVVISAGRGSVVVSYNRDEICLERCNSPEICPVTKLRKLCAMYELIKFAYPEVFLLISHQLEPGLGAIRGEDFLLLLNEAEKRDRIVVATACKCHGVITALKRI